jgi:peptidylprolyl isomerase
MKALTIILSALLLIFVMGCGGGGDESSEEPASEAQKVESEVENQPVKAPPPGTIQPLSADLPQFEGDTVTTPSGLKYIDIVEGTGESPSQGQICELHYTGWLANGTKFDSSRDRGQPFQTPIGVGRVIPGWDEGVASMKVGGRRLLIIPSNLGYGSRSMGDRIPANSTLVFDVELLSIK